jgi:hypothetical protein
MLLNNTIILPGDNPGLSQKLLKALIDKQDILPVVIFGKDAAAEDAVQIADHCAGSPPAGITRKVAWMQDVTMLDYLKTLIKAGAGGQPGAINTDDHIGVAISLSDVLMSVIPKTPPVDFVTMEMAFIEAGTI